MDTSTTTLLNFRRLIISSWQAFASICDTLPKSNAKDIVDDWLQANWEILVEQSICQPNDFLEVYGDGADCNGASSRILFPDKSATCKIVCIAEKKSIFDFLSGKMLDIQEMNFDQFVTWENNYYHVRPPLAKIPSWSSAGGPAGYEACALDRG